MNKEITIRELTNNDSAKLANFLSGLTGKLFDTWNRFGHSFDYARTQKLARIQCGLSKKQEIGFVALNIDGEIIAYSYLRFFPEKKTKKHIASLGIVVAPKYQGKKVGKQLMRYMHNWAKKKGIKKVWLATYTRNKAAMRLYKKLGYQVEGIFMFDEYSKYGWDHVVSMALMLDKRFSKAKQERKSLINKIERDIG